MFGKRGMLVVLAARPEEQRPHHEQIEEQPGRRMIMLSSNGDSGKIHGDEGVRGLERSPGGNDVERRPTHIAKPAHLHGEANPAERDPDKGEHYRQGDDGGRVVVAQFRRHPEGQESRNETRPDEPQTALEIGKPFKAALERERDWKHGLLSCTHQSRQSFKNLKRNRLMKSDQSTST
jgi:hypothetical protein